MIYFLIYITLLLAGVMDLYKVNYQQKRIVYITLVIFFMVLGGIRWDTGTDWNSYIDFYTGNQTWKDFSQSDFEFGYAALNYLEKQVSGSYVFHLVVFTAITIAIKAWFFSQYRDVLLISLLLYFCYQLGDMFPVRQSLAISLTMFSTRYIISRKFIPFMIVLVLASSFHITSFLFIFSYFVFNLKISNKMMVILLAVAIVIGLLGSFAKGIFDFLLLKFGQTSIIGSKVLAYTTMEEADFSGSEINPQVAFMIALVRRAVVIPVFLLFRNKASDKFPQYNSYLNLLISGNIIYFTTSIVLPIMKRASAYYEIFEILLFSMVIMSFSNRSWRIVAYTVTALYALSKLITVLLHFWDLYIPYYSIFNIPVQPRN